MKEAEECLLLRVFIGDSDVSRGEALFHAVVTEAMHLGLAGATVLRGTAGFGANRRVHTTKLLELSMNLPLVVEIVDTADKVQRLLPFLDEAVDEGLVTIQPVRVMKYRRGGVEERDVNQTDASA